MLKSVELDREESYWSLIGRLQFRALAERVGSNPLLWVVVALGPVVAGVSASFWPEEIKNSLQLTRSFSGTSWPATSFWLAIFVSGLSFGLGQWSQSRAGAALRVMIRRLQTLPPSGFLYAYRDSFRAAYNQAILVLLSPQSTQQDVEQVIRVVLGAIVECARDFDEAGDATYGANIMLWKEVGQGFESPAPVHLLPYVPCDPNVLGYLELVPALSTTTALGQLGYLPDTTVSALTISVPVNAAKVLDARTHSRDPVPPGAAQAFLSGDAVVYDSVASYLRWLDDHSSRDLEVVIRMKEYFTTGASKGIKSFASQPLLSPSGQVQLAPTAVLNLHSDRENILQDSGQTLFIPLIEPFCVILATLLEKRAVLAIAAPVVTPPTQASSTPPTQKGP